MLHTKSLINSGMSGLWEPLMVDVMNTVIDIHAVITIPDVESLESVYHVDKLLRTCYQLQNHYKVVLIIIKVV